MKGERLEGKNYAHMGCSEIEGAGVSFVDQDCQADSENIDERDPPPQPPR